MNPDLAFLLAHAHHDELRRVAQAAQAGATNGQARRWRLCLASEGGFRPRVCTVPRNAIARA